MKKVIRLTESDLVRIVRQTPPTSGVFCFGYIYFI